MNTDRCILPTDITGDNLVPCGSDKMVKADDSSGWIPLCIDCRVRRMNEIRDGKESFYLKSLGKDHSNRYLQPAATTTIYCLELPTGNLKFGETQDLYRRLTEWHRDFGLSRDQRITVLAAREGTVSSEALIHQDLREFKQWTLLGEQYKDNEITREYAEAIGLVSGLNDIYRYTDQYRPTKDYAIKPELNPNR